MVRSLADFTAAEGIKYEIPFSEDGYCRSLKVDGSISPGYSNPEFVHQLRASICPIVPVRKVVPPPGVLSVAAHLRTGGRFDSEESKNRLPHKFLGKTACLKMVLWLYGHLQEKELYVHVFTDDHRSGQILQWFERHSDDRNINWGVTIDNTDRYRMLSDLFSMPNFDYLVRAKSHFSLFAQVLGDFKLVLISRQSFFDPATREVLAEGFDVFTPEEFYRAFG